MIHYIIVRRDFNKHILRHWNKTGRLIGSSTGVTAAQVTHAAGESFGQFIRSSRRLFPKETIAIVLGVPTERRLKSIERRLRQSKIKHAAIREPDAPWNGQLMAIGLWPADFKASPFPRLKLL